MRKLLAAALLLLSGAAHAQIITVNENLATSSNTFYLDTNSPRLIVATASYTGSVPGAVLFVGSNVVVGTGTGAAGQVVIYATGTIMLNGVAVGSGSGVNVGILTATQTWSGAETFAGGVTFSTNVVGNNVIHNSSCSANFTATASPANLYPYGLNIGYSTVTIITAGSSRLRVWYSGGIANNTPARYAASSFLLDGTINNGTDYRQPMSVVLYDSPNYDASWEWITNVQSAGIHSATFTLGTNGIGTAFACGSLPIQDVFATVACQFCVEEVK